MDAVAITSESPLLEVVFGPLSVEQDGALRSQLLELSSLLTATARRLSGRAGLQGRGLELRVSRSGQASIGSSIGTGDGTGAMVDFIVELRPSWYYGTKTGNPGFEIEVEVLVDCLHTVDHRSMHRVLGHTTTASSAQEAVQGLSDATRDLVKLATERPVADWTALGADPT